MTYKTFAPTLLMMLAPVATAHGAPSSFAAEIGLHFQMTACGSGKQDLTALHGATYKKHCRAVKQIHKRYTTLWVSRVNKFFAKHRPADVPKRVVTPFSGGDLAALMAVFPGATEYTSISLEASGDPRLISKLRGRKLAAALTEVRKTLKKYYGLAHHRTSSLRSHSLSSLTGELAFAVSALQAHGYAPVDLRYFHIAADGALKYVTAEQIAAVDKGGSAVETRKLFSNMELHFRKGDGPQKIYRHLRQDLSNKGFHPSSPLYRHLEAKKAICGMVKAGSYLMPMKMFSNIRAYMLRSITWMVADSTGPSPRQAAAAGVVQRFFGAYKGAFSWRKGSPGKHHDPQRLRIWGKQPKRWLPFRFGYPDSSQNNHLIIYTKK